MTPERKAQLRKWASDTFPCGPGGDPNRRVAAELLDALDAAERRAAEAEAEANGYAQAIDRVLVELATLKRAIPGSGIILATFEVGLQALSRGAKERALALASVATGGQGGEGT